MFDLKLLIILALGILLGAIIANKDFRRKFFIGFRKFLVQIGQGARSYSAQQQKGRGESQRKPYPDEVKHRYIQEHKLVKCPRCGGTGRIPKKMPKLLDEKLWGEQTEECPNCRGTGKVYD